VTAIELDVSAALGEPAHLSGSFYPAPSQPTSSQQPLLVCLPGGTYNRGYFDLPIPGYSFAQHMIDRGYGLVTFDQLGTGDSTRPTREIGLADQASAVASAVRQLPEVTGHAGPFIGVGHSMGGYVAMLQQHHDRTYLALAILGTTNQWVEPLGLPPELLAAAATRAGRDALVDQMASAIPDRFVEADRTPLLPWFHLPDVPSSVIAEDVRTTSTVVPSRCAAQSSVPGIVRDEAADIDVPIFLGYGEVDVSPDPRREVEAFAASHDITLYLLKGSGHCHNMASTRHLLWDRLAAWFDECA
jgi:pimeloyl-ACP methyl ester carboxylesterase